MIEKLARIKLVAIDVDGTFTDGTLFYDNDGNVIKGFFAHDGLGLELLKRADIKHGFITGRNDNATKARAAYLGVDFHISGVGDKSVSMRKLFDEFSIDPSESLYIGDDLNDLPAFALAGVSVAVANASEEVRKRADFVTVREGGKGAVREAVEMILKAKNIDIVELWMSDKDRSVGMQ
ncbi:KdsC family phosphatase [Candidatus Latescibacterota bacterium]